jgi:hypothetical protein
VLPKIDNRSFFKLKYETLRALFDMRIWQCITTVCFLWAVSGFSAAQVPVDFAKDVLPVLSDNCFNCHGPDAATREGGLRLDVQERAFGEGDSGAPPIVSGDPNASEILARMLSDDPDVVMPPPDQVKRPTPEQIQRIKTWIQQGAHWQSHWAFDRPSRPNLPEVSDPAWNQNPIDRFVLDKLQQQKLAPSSMASRATLVRRLFLDVVGLPPSPEQVDEFLNDQSEDAYEKLVDRLLASPHYGEHMATFWLDAARFADTNGYQNDFRRSMWLWRDWVIKAYNDNLPYDQFTIEQLAGDMLPNPTLEQKIASGFNRNHRSNTEGGSINEEWRVENVIDRVETTSTVFLGLTMGCARCHDHKFDPISQEEFYQFYVYFNNVDEKGVYIEKRGNAGPIVAKPTDQQKQQLAELNAQLELRRQIVDQKRATDRLTWATRRAEAKEFSTPEVQGEALVLASRSGDDSAQVESLAKSLVQDQRIASSLFGPAISFNQGVGPHVDLGAAFEFDAEKDFTVSTWVKPKQFGAIVSRMDGGPTYRGFDMLISPDGRLSVHLIHNWPGNATKITAEVKIPQDHWSNVVVVCQAPGKAENIQVYLNGQAVRQTVNSDSLDGSILTKHPVWLGLREQTPPFLGLIGSLRIWPKALNDQAVRQIYDHSMEHMIQASPDEASEEVVAEIKHHDDFAVKIQRQSTDRQLQQLLAKIERLEKAMPTTMVMKELEKPRQAYLLNRGVYDQPDKSKPVSAAIPKLFKSGKTPRNRLELARWLVDGENPLTARVAVNQIWARYFGQGLVKTSENFGVQSPPPMYPELLDWLACEFVDSGWDMKALHRLILTSATYRQTSNSPRTAFESDPNNERLSRGSRFRLPAETIRDNALAISGLLTKKIGGPSVKPYQPAGLWADLAGGAGEPPYRQSTGDDLYRRSLYTYRKRTVPHPTVVTFDGVGRDICAVSRDRTNTPLQALALLNDVTYVEAAIRLAIRVVESEAEHQQRVRLAFRHATSRWPDDEELGVLLSAFEKYKRQFDAAPETARQFLTTGDSNLATNNDSASPVSLASYAAVCSVILNLDEVITRE